MKAKQLSIFDELATPEQKRAFKERLVHGGEPSVGKRKLRRPLATKKWMHLVLKSKKATGKYWMLNKQHAEKIETVIVGKGQKFGIDLKEYVNMGNHIHFQLRIKSRKSFQAFLRAVTSLIARLVTGAKRGNKFGKFWDALAFTRIVSTFEDLIRLEGYIIGNTIERRHGYAARQVYLNALNKWLKKLKQAAVPLNLVSLR